MATEYTREIVTVTRVNGHGFQDTAGTWLNISKFSKAEDVVMPAVGQTVAVLLDKAGFIRKIEEAPASELVELSEPTPAAPHALPDKDTQIIRESALKSAIESLGAGAEVKAILERAEAFERWIGR
ncbi:MAG: hypothetical protein KGL39_56410 [Patescibacteria group bacterium]|nr:hypothetical protein [Patescibacteria group bacterium]